MIPDHIIDKAVAAAGDNWVMVFDWEHDKLYAQVHAALEAVAADIWEDGYEAGASDEHAINTADKHGKEWPELTPNPYRIEHT